ncbi:MAG: alpha/beta hydrolase [Anaerolineales bacterium]|nr:alpha/beta hydrolase [Anaerolineales bacterium]
MIQTKTIPLNGVNIHYVEAGQAGPALVILHGITGSHTSFLHLIPALAQQAHVYALDLRGHYLSGHTPGAYQLADYGQDVVAFLQSVVKQPAILVGHSLGGMVAVWAAAQAAEWVRGVFLEEPPLFISQPPRLQETPFYGLFTFLRQQLQQYHGSRGRLEDMMAFVGQSPVDAGRTMLEAFGPELVRQRAMELDQMDPTILDVAIDGLLLGQENPDVLLRQVRCPAYLLAGQVEFGGVLEASDVERIRAALPTCPHIVFQQTGHLIHREKPEAYLQALQPFITRINGHNTDAGSQ